MLPQIFLADNIRLALPNKRNFKLFTTSPISFTRKFTVTDELHPKLEIFVQDLAQFDSLQKFTDSKDKYAVIRILQQHLEF